MKVGVVTFEYSGLTKNGGIGTAYSRLVDLLVSQGHKVTVFFVDILNQYKDSGNFKQSEIDINIIKIPHTLDSSHSWAGARSIAVYEELLKHENEFNVIHFHDCLGMGWATLNSKKLGIAFNNTEFILGLHGPNFWVNDAHGYLQSNPIEYLQSRMEKQCVEFSHTVVSPSQYMIDYLKSYEWVFPENTSVIPNVNNLAFIYKKNKISSKVELHNIKRIIFFGRLESRKGVHLFLDTLKYLFDNKKLWRLQQTKDQVEIVFMGKDTQDHEGTWMTGVIHKYLEPMNQLYHYKFYCDFSSEDCQNYFKSHPDSLICIPSLADNSPYVVVEALEQNLNFISTNVGGQKEIIHEQSHFDTLTNPTPKDLGNKIINKYKNPYKLSVPSDSLLTANKKWLDLHKKLLNAKTKQQAKLKSLGLIILSHGNIDKLKNTLDTIEAQKQKDISVSVYNIAAINKPKEIILSNLTLKYKFKNFKFINSYGAPIPEVTKHFLNADKNVDFYLILNEGDLLDPESISKIKTMISVNPTTDVFLLGYDSSGIKNYPLPADINFTLFYDTYKNYPLVFSKKYLQQISEKAQLISLTIDNHDLLNSEHTQTKFELCPFIALYSDDRKQYHAYTIANHELVKNRLKLVQSYLPKALRRSIEMSTSMILAGKNL